MGTTTLGDGEVLDYRYDGQRRLIAINNIEDTGTGPSAPDCEDDNGCENITDKINLSILYECLGLNDNKGKNIFLTLSLPSTGEQREVLYTANLPINGGGRTTYSHESQATIQIQDDGTVTMADLMQGVQASIADCISLSESQLSTMQGALSSSLLGFNGGSSIPITPGGGATPGPGGATPTSRLFALELHYDDGNPDLDAPDRHNGNISWMEWAIPGEGQHSYGYTYDAANRLTKARYRGYDNISCEVIPGNAYQVDIGYRDGRGNIDKIRRKGLLEMSPAGSPQYGVIDDLTMSSYMGNQLTSVTEQESKDRGFANASTTYAYHNGNMTSDGQGTTVNLYTHLDNPVSITTPGGELQYTYDALGSALHSAAATNQNEPVERHYQGMFEYENGTLKSIYHEHGRVVYNEELEGFSGDAYAEWHISDHLGNVRVAYVDKNVDGYAVTDPSDAAANEVTATHHYYPHGMRFEGNFINPTGNDVRQEYNGIERFDDISPTLSFATYRSHDASLGRWMQIDPKAEQAGYHNSPYASMNNNPISMADPHGDLPILAAAAIGAAFSMGSTIASGMINKNLGNYNSITSAAMWGAIGGVASFGIGSAFGPTGSFLNEVGRAAAHGTSSGLQSHIQGGSFGSGFLAGSISSGLSSGATAANFGDAAMIGVGALGGGIGSSIGGGSFLGGFSQGLAVGAFNHAMHKSQNEGRRDPPTDEELLNYLAGELNNGRITPEEYTRAWYLVEDGAWGLVGHVLWENKVDIALTAGGAGLLKILSKTRVIKDGFLIGGKQLQLHRHHLNYLKGKGMSGTANVWHINIGKKHIIFNPRHWGKLTSDWWNPIR